MAAAPRIGVRASSGENPPSDAASGPLTDGAVTDGVLAEVQLLDSTGVFVLVDTYKRAKERGVGLTVEHPQQIVRRVLEVCGLLDLLTQGEH